MKSHFVLNKRTGVLHRLPSHERCNVDQVHRKFRVHLLSIQEARAFGFRRRCAWCFGER